MFSTQAEPFRREACSRRARTWFCRQVHCRSISSAKRSKKLSSRAAPSCSCCSSPSIIPCSLRACSFSIIGCCSIALSSLLEVLAATNVVVRWRRRQRRERCERLLVERVLQDRFHALEATGVTLQGASGGCFHAGCRVLIGEPDDAQTGPIAHLRMRLLRQNALDESSGVWSDLFRPVHHARGCPLQMGLMALRSMLILRDHLFSPTGAGMGGHALSLVEDLNRGRCRANFDPFVNQMVRHAVEVGIEGDVVIDIHSCVRPLTHVERFRRKGQHGGTLDVFEHSRSRSVTLFEASMIQFFQQLPNRVVQILKPKEGAMTQGGDDPTFRYEYSSLRLGLVPRAVRSRRYNSDAVMHG